MSLSDNLIANEQVVFEAKKHWISPLRDSLIPILLLLAAYGVGWISPDSHSGITGAVGNLLDLIRNILVIVSVFWIIYNILVWRSAQFAVTNLRVIREEGFISKRQSATLLANITDVKSRVPALGGPLGFGDLTIYTQSGDAGADRFTSITQPIVFRDKIMDKKMADAGMAHAAASASVATAASAASAGAPAPTPVPDPTATLAQLAALRDSGAITSEEYEAKKAEILARI
jgi:Short C-terminal domain/Bacterial PH domain